MKEKWRQTTTSVIISSLLIFGGISLTILLTTLTRGPGFTYNVVNRIIIIVFSCVSFIFPGIFGLMSAYRGANSRMYGFHISMETLFLLLAVSAFISFTTTMKTFSPSECTENKRNGTCVCGESDTVFSTCDEAAEQTRMAYVTVVLYLVTWFIGFTDLIRSMCISCCFQDDELPGVIINGKKIEHFKTVRTI